MSKIEVGGEKRGGGIKTVEVSSLADIEKNGRIVNEEINTAFEAGLIVNVVDKDGLVVELDPQYELAVVYNAGEESCSFGEAIYKKSPNTGGSLFDDIVNNNYESKSLEEGEKERSRRILEILNRENNVDIYNGLNFSGISKNADGVAVSFDNSPSGDGGPFVSVLVALKNSGEVTFLLERGDNSGIETPEVFEGVVDSVDELPIDKFEKFNLESARDFCVDLLNKVNITKKK